MQSLALSDNNNYSDDADKHLYLFHGFKIPSFLGIENNNRDNQKVPAYDTSYPSNMVTDYDQLNKIHEFESRTNF
jgi:hypothetical protein